MESLSEMKAPDNPWDVSSIYEFNFFCCPECDCKVNTKQSFVSHALECHPRAAEGLKSVSDGSLNDINLPGHVVGIKKEHIIQQPIIQQPIIKQEIVEDDPEDEDYVPDPPNISCEVSFHEDADAERIEGSSEAREL